MWVYFFSKKSKHTVSCGVLCTAGTAGTDTEPIVCCMVYQLNWFFQSMNVSNFFFAYVHSKILYLHFILFIHIFIVYGNEPVWIFLPHIETTCMQKLRYGRTTSQQTPFIGTQKTLKFIKKKKKSINKFIYVFMRFPGVSDYTRYSV